jgi:beta-galactosidase/beta-glucuronidase
MHHDVRSYEKGHPNPLFYRSTWLSLNGKWSFYFDDKNEGLQGGWSSKIPEGCRSITVPYSYETPESGINEQKEHNILWYFKTFNNPHYVGKTMLHFERCDYVFDGWVNGHYLGKHVGGYDAFRYDISDFLVDGENLIVVRAYDDKDPTHVRGKQTWKEKPFDGFFPTTSGLYGDVWLEEVAKASFQGYDARGSFDEKSVYFRLLFTPEAIGSQAILNVSYRGRAVCSTSFEVNNIYMEEELAIPAKLFHRWSPAYPCLYDLEMVLVRNGETSDRVLSYFGINSVSQRKNAITLNGQKRYLKFVLYQGYNPKGGLTFDEKGYLQDIALIKSMGFNGVRIHQKVESELFYYLADREGLLTDVEMPSTHLYNRIEADEVSSEFGRIVTDHVGHPSVIAYVAFHESWGLEDINGSGEQQYLPSALYHMANRIDWSRPAISNDGWEHTDSDILTLHNYAKDGDALRQHYFGLKNKLAANENFEAATGKGAFAGDYHYSGQPYVLSSFFGVSLAKDASKSWNYGESVATPRSFLKRYRSLLKAIKHLGFAGYCAREFADTYQEKDGFVNEKRTPKVSVDALKRANKNF